MNRTEFRQLAEDRLLDAQVLLDAPTGGRWSAAYYLAGYAVECGLKACIMAHVERTGEIFIDKRFSEKCFTHRLIDLIQLGDLKQALEDRLKTEARFALFWALVAGWTELSRSQQKSEADARGLLAAIVAPSDGVLTWIRTYW